METFFLPAVLDFIYFGFICWNPQAFIAQSAFLHLSSVLFLVGILSLDLEFRLLAFLSFHASLICQTFNFEAEVHVFCSPFPACSRMITCQWLRLVKSFAQLNQSYDSNQHNSPLLELWTSRLLCLLQSQQVGAAPSSPPVYVQLCKQYRDGLQVPRQTFFINATM